MSQSTQRSASLSSSPPESRRDRFSIKEAASRLGVSYDTVYKAVHGGSIAIFPRIRPGSPIQIPGSEIERLSTPTRLERVDELEEAGEGMYDRLADEAEGVG